MVAIAGIDWAWGTPPEAALDAAGVRFAARYLCSDRYASKRITRAEADWHKKQGRGIVLVWEDTANRMLAGKGGGITDARAADGQCDRFGLAGCPVYFACDWDAAQNVQPKIDAYLDGAASVIGRDRVGLYGGYWPLSRARTAGKARYFWGTRAWSGGNWQTCGWKPHIMQGVSTTIGGTDADWDTAYYDDYGQWKGGGPAADWTEEAIMALPTLTQGDTDTAGHVFYVHRAQALVKVIGQINALPAAARLAADGTFGPETAGAVQAVQRFFGITADSVVGRDTWTKLLGALRWDSP